MTHTPLQLRRAIDPIMGHNMIEVDMGKDWFALCQVGNVHTNNEEAEQQYGSLADAACTLFLAAPDLLAALKAVMHTLDYARDNCKPRGAVGRFLFEVKGGCGEHGDLFNARAAIEKAEGN